MNLASLKRAVLLTLLALGARAENPKPARASDYAPGRIFQRSDGWKIISPTGTWFVSQRRVKDVDPEVAAVVALFPGKPVRQSWGWTITGAGQRVEVFKETGGLTVSTARETFYMHRQSDCYSLSPGQPGVRRLTPVEAFNFTRQGKEKRGPKKGWKTAR